MNEEEEGYIVEFITIGNSVKVTVIDPETLTEVSLIGSTAATRDDLTTLAVRKLHYVIGKNANEPS